MQDHNNFTATYSPDDNKLRLYSVTRLDVDTYSNLKRLGFRFAPKQDCWVAPMWTPERADFIEALAGEISDDDRDLVSRAEDRAERFAGYADNRAKDAQRAHDQLSALSGDIPLGQPILVGHHSEKHAKRQAKRIEQAAERAYRMAETSDYWERRAARAIAHARYKEEPRVRFNRIKRIKADMAKEERSTAPCKYLLQKCRELGDRLLEQQEALEAVAKKASACGCYALFSWSREEGYNYAPHLGGDRFVALHDVLLDPDTYKGMTREMVAERLLKYLEAKVINGERWDAHFKARIVYEEAMLKEAGVKNPDEQKAADKAERAAKAKTDPVPIVNYPGEGMKHITAVQWAAINKDYKGVRVRPGNAEHGSYRYRTAMFSFQLHDVYITDKKRVDIPPPKETKVVEIPPASVTSGELRPKGSSLLTAATQQVKAMRETSKDALSSVKEFAGAIATSGVTTVVADQLFATPMDLAEAMVQRAKQYVGERPIRWLEPNVGTCRIAFHLLDYFGTDGKCFEINEKLAGAAEATLQGVEVLPMDFLLYEPEQPEFDVIVMNPPFGKAEDIKHIEHALGMLKPDGILISIAAGGPRQNEKFSDNEQLGTYVEKLPDGTFKDEGTNVSSILVIKEN